MNAGGNKRTYDLQWGKQTQRRINGKRPSTGLTRRRPHEPKSDLYDVPRRPLSACKRRSKPVITIAADHEDSPKHVPNPPPNRRPSAIIRRAADRNTTDMEVDEAYTESKNARAAIRLSVNKVQELVDGIEMTEKAHLLETNGSDILPEETTLDNLPASAGASPVTVASTSPQRGALFDFLEKPPPHTSDTVLNLVDDDDDEILFEPDAVVPTEKSTSELYTMLHSLSSQLGTLYRCCKGFIRRGIISYDHDYSEACVSALGTLKLVWGKFTDIVNTINTKTEEMTQVNHKLLLVQERQRGIEVSGQEHRLNYLTFRTMFRWQKRVLWKQRIAAAGIGSTTTEEISPPQERKHSKIIKIRRQSKTQGIFGNLSPGTTSIIISMEHMTKLRNINSKTLDLWNEFITRSCDQSEGVFLASQGEGCAANKGYALIFADCAQTALRFSLQLQFASNYIHWPSNIVSSSYCLSQLDSDVNKSSLYYQQGLFHRDDVEACRHQGTELDKLESIAASIGVEEEERIQHGDSVPYHISKGGNVMFYGPRMRISLHDGPVLQDESGYYGRGLMMTSFLASKCSPGFVVISSSVRESLSKIIESDGLFEIPHPLAPITDFSSYNWRESGHQVSYDFVPNGDTYYALLSTELVSRAAIIEPVVDIYEHERLKYNPHWWMRFCNYPPDVWSSFGSEEVPPPPQAKLVPSNSKAVRFPVEKYERQLMESDDNVSLLLGLFMRLKSAVLKQNPVKAFLSSVSSDLPETELETLITKIIQFSNNTSDAISLHSDDATEREEFVQTLSEYRL